MSRFLTKLRMENASESDDGLWVLVSDLVYESDLAKRVIAVPAGFPTDLASVPRLPIVYWLSGGTSTEAAVVHDWLYRSHLLPRDVADAVLREASAVTGVPAWRRWMMWAGVRAFGGAYWKTVPGKLESD